MPVASVAGLWQIWIAANKRLKERSVEGGSELLGVKPIRRVQNRREYIHCNKSLRVAALLTSRGAELMFEEGGVNETKENLIDAERPKILCD